MSSTTVSGRGTTRSEGKREQIRAVAGALFRAHGFEATTMDAITAAAGISKRTLYKYYPSKEALLGDIVHQLTLGRSGPAALELPPLASAAALEETLFQLASAISANHRAPEFLGLVRVVVAEAPRFPDLAEQYSAAVIEPGIATLRAVFDHARACGLPLVAETDSAVRLFMGGLLFWTYNALFATGQPHWPTAEELRQHARLTVAAVTDSHSD